MTPAADSADTHALNARLLRFRSHPEQEDAHALAEDLIAARRYGDARGVAVSAQIDDDTSDARLLVLEARAWYLDRDLVRAQAALVRAARLDPNCAEAFRWLGEVLLKRGDPARSQRALERALDLLPGDPDIERLLERARQLARHAPEEPEPAETPPVRSAAPRTLLGPGPMARAPVTAAPVPPAQERAAPAPARTRTPASQTAPRVAPSPFATSRAMPTPAPAPAPALPVAVFGEEEETTASFPRSFSDSAARDDDTDEDTLSDVESGFDDLSEGALESPIEPTRPGTLSSPGRRAAAPAETPAEARRLFSDTLPSSTPPPSSPGTTAAPSAGGRVTSAAGKVPAASVSSPGTSRAPSASGQVRSASAAGNVRSPSSGGELRSPSARGELRAPSTAGELRAPRTPAELRAPSTAGELRAPRTPAELRAPSTAGELRAPRTPAELRAPSTAGELRAPSTPGEFRSPSSAGASRSPSAAGTSRAASSAGGTRSPSSAGTTRSFGVSSPGALAAGMSSGTELDVEVDELADDDRSALAAAPAHAATRPGFGAAPAAREPGSAPNWDAPSVVAMWPSLEPLSEPPPAMRGDHASPPAGAWRDDDAADAAFEPGRDREDLEPGTLPAADLPLGEAAGAPDDPGLLIESLREQGIFEPAEANVEAPTWTEASQVPRTGTRVGRTLIGVWLVSLLLLGGGYFGWRQWITHRHGTAASLVAQATAAAFESDHARLVDAERLLRQARDNHPRSSEVPAAELFVHCQRVLENGSRELSSLRAALARAERLHADAAHVAVARAVLAVYSGASAELQPLLAKATAAAKGEPALLYVVGRLQHRLGQPEAAAHLRAAAAAAPDSIAAALGLAELHQERGETQEALAAFDAVLARRPGHLRAKLWRTFLTADDLDPVRALRELDALAKQGRAGAPIDRILWALARARLLGRSGAQDKVADALREAAASGASEPRLLALVATEARRAGQLGIAQQAASQAASAAPDSAAYRALLASILLDCNDGERALQLLSELPADQPALIRMRARAALQTGDAEALRSTLQALDAQVAAGEKGGEVTALRLRVRAALEPKPELLQEARALLRRAPSDPAALRAAGEVALALREPSEAVRAFEQLAQLMPDDAEAQYLLGRARRMATDAKGAEAALRRALELSPGYVGALAALGGLLLDSGKYAEADALYQQLSAHNALAGRLGRAEALIALGQLDDAHVQVSGVPEAQRESAAAREVGAKLALARHKHGEALALLRPLIEGEQRKAPALALYGDALYAADQVDSAAGAYEAALELDGELPEALLGRANVHLRAERAGEALELLERAQRALATRLRAPEVRARALALIGHAYVQRDKRGDEERARDVLRQAVRLPNPPAEAYFFLGDSLGGRRTPEAAEAFKRYLELEPRGDYADRARRALGPLLP